LTRNVEEQQRRSEAAAACSIYPQLAVLRPILTSAFALVTIGAAQFRANWIHDWRIMGIESRA
jgi:hypothetical protein